MSVPSLPIRVDRLQSKINKLMQLHTKVKKENENMQTEKEQLLDTLEQRRKSIRELEEHNKRIRLAKSLADTGDSSSDIKLKINEMVREIDKCIAYLNK
ncbi:MAG TPA: hypothetical protein EYN89_09790 [Flavobacteriales bacterium]|nr:hypothetical protein [Flavobacteriales bacterium]